jgi:hypothetical protein
MDAARIRALIRQQFATAAELTRLTGRPFTVDGHAVGSAGEVLAAARFNLKLTDPSTKGIDAIAPDGRCVEIKATGGDRGVALRGREPLADHLLVFTISAEGQEAVIYNGPATLVWGAIAHKAMPDNGQRQISLARLRELQQTVLAEQMLPEVS